MAAIQGIYNLPAFYESNPIDLPTCMYRMSSYHNNKASENPDVNQYQEDVLKLESKQGTILKDLEKLKIEISSLASKFGVKLPKKKSITAADHVISANPQDPPLSLFALQHIMNQRNMVHSTSAFIHSSVSGSDVTKVPAFQKSTNDEGRQSPCLLTIIWKNVPDLPILIISSNHTPLVGEFTIARHLCRAFLPGLYSKLGIEDIAHVDQWISFASNSVLNSKSKERSNAMHTLNCYLGNKTWLVGNQMSVADVAVASAVIKSGSLQSTFANVNKWIKNLPLFPLNKSDFKM